MKQILISILFFCSFSNYAYLQTDNEQTGFESTEDNITNLDLSDDEILKYIEESDTANSGYFFGGQIRSIFREPLDSVLIIANYGDSSYTQYTSADGLFNIPVYSDERSILVDIHIKKEEFHSYDTSIVLKKKINIPVLRIALIPKYKILLRGRLFAGNLPLEGVHVTVNHDDITKTTETRGCYYDSDNYWNCLFNGMFKVEITADNPKDSVYISFSKKGYKSGGFAMQFKEYDGNIINYRLRYANFLSEFPKNNLSLQLAFPFWSDKDWFVGLRYFRILELGNFNRLGAGLETVLLISQLEHEFTTFPGTEIARVDSFYYTPYIGPSVFLWLTNPEVRNFSTYIGNSFHLNLNSSEISLQPFIGTRFFLDMNKSFGVEIRYIKSDIERTTYTFNPYGDAIPHKENITRDKIIFSIGMQIVL